MVGTRIFGKKLSKGKKLGNLEVGTLIFLCATHRPVLIHIPVKYHVDILTVTEI